MQSKAKQRTDEWLDAAASGRFEPMSRVRSNGHHLMQPTATLNLRRRRRQNYCSAHSEVYH